MYFGRKTQMNTEHSWIKSRRPPPVWRSLRETDPWWTATGTTTSISNIIIIMIIVMVVFLRTLLQLFISCTWCSNQPVPGTRPISVFPPSPPGDQVR